MNTLQEQRESLLLVKAADYVTHLRPSIAPQTAPEASCEYCHSLHALSRCPSCGAPRRAKKVDSRTEWEKWKAWEHGPVTIHDSGPVWDGEGYKSTQVTAYPPKKPL